MKLRISRFGLSIVFSLVAISSYSSAIDALATTATFSVPGNLSPWTFTEELPIAGDGEAVSVSDWVYMISGDVAYRAQATETGDLQSWIPETNTLITPRGTHVLATDGQHIYAIGGIAISSGSRLSSVEFTTVEPDGGLTAWSETTLMDTVRSGPSATIYNGRLYVAGGATSPSSWLNTVIYAPINLDGSLGAWQNAAPMTIERNGLVAVAARGFLYATGGDSHGQIYATCERAVINSDGSLGAWEIVNSMNTPRYSHEVALFGGYIYVLGGSPDWNAYLDSVEFTYVNADGSLSAWAYTSPLNVGRHHLGVAVTDRNIYALGGRTTDGITASVEYTGYRIYLPVILLNASDTTS